MYKLTFSLLLTTAIVLRVLAAPIIPIAPVRASGPTGPTGPTGTTGLPLPTPTPLPTPSPTPAPTPITDAFNRTVTVQIAQPAPSQAPVIQPPQPSPVPNLDATAQQDVYSVIDPNTGFIVFTLSVPTGTDQTQVLNKINALAPSK